MSEAQVGVIGGSGFYQMRRPGRRRGAAHRHALRRRRATPMVLGTLEGVRVAFLSRHGAGHRILPSEVPYRANIWALKYARRRAHASRSTPSAACARRLRRWHLVVPGPAHRPHAAAGRARSSAAGWWRTSRSTSRSVRSCSELLLTLRARRSTPTCTAAARTSRSKARRSRRRPSRRLYRSWGASVIGMTAMPEAKLAREAEICYATLALVTDYDTWHEDHAPVTGEMIIENLLRNFERARRIVARGRAHAAGRARLRVRQRAREGADHVARRSCPTR